MYIDKYVAYKEAINELLLILTMTVVLMIANVDGDLAAMISYGWFALFLILINLIFNLVASGYMVWKLLNALEVGLPSKEGITTNLKKKIDLFRTK